MTAAPTPFSTASTTAPRTAPDDASGRPGPRKG